ncbi:MAG: DMT family transporter [Clostridia bacterium]|nr:DMT family transporter [Clostridia bacterium]
MSFIRQTFLPVLAAFIWGTAFVAQVEGSERLDAFAFNMARSVVAAVFLFLVAWGVRVWKKRNSRARGVFTEPTPEEKKRGRRALLISGIICGTMLTVAANLQQAGIALSGAGKSGFITALYVVLVPVLGLFLNKRVPARVWISVLLAILGLYLLSIQAGTFRIEKGDLFLILCALAFSFQIMTIDHYSGLLNGIELSCAQFVVVAIESGILMLLFSDVAWADFLAVIGPVLYAGLLSSGVAYTLQIIAQKDANPTLVSLLMSLEAVFAVVSGAIVLHERLTAREYIGCAIMFIAVVLSQLPLEKWIKEKATPSDA